MKLHITDRALRRDLKLPDGQPQLVAWDTEQAGFGAVVGRARVTFVVNRRVEGRLHREAIGHWSGACVSVSALFEGAVSTKNEGVPVPVPARS